LDPIFFSEISSLFPLISLIAKAYDTLESGLSNSFGS